jgi:hypothetical protein
MAEPLDVDARLAQGRPAVDNVGDYVWACHLLGYQNPDLTLHSAQVRDWYNSEDGLDLAALEADRAALESAATAADGARQLQERQLDALTDAWQGRGGDASREFLLRHGEASTAAASAVRTAVDALAALRDDLWRAIDEKVATAIAIDDRRQGERAQWQAATQTVTTGAGDRAIASELIDQQVKPFVDNDVRSDWLAAMQKAMAAVSAAFDVATGALTADPLSTFEVPGDLGPTPTSSPTPSSPTGSVSPAEIAGTVPAGWSPPMPSASPTAASLPVSAAGPEPFPSAMQAAPLAAPPATTSMPATPSVPSMPSLGEMGGGLPGGAGGLTGLGTQLADAIGGLFGRPDDALPDPQELNDDLVDGDVPEPDDVDQTTDGEDVDDEDREDEELDDEDADETDGLAETDEPAADPDDVCAEDQPVQDVPPSDPAATPPPASMPPPPEPIVEPPPGEPLGAETPCEIAADELPQAGPEN